MEQPKTDKKTGGTAGRPSPVMLKKPTVLLWLLLAAAVVIADQWSKAWIAERAATLAHNPIILIPGVLRFSYVENDGMAFGMLGDHPWVFMIASVVAILGVTVYLVCYSPDSVLCRAALMLIVGGGIGNMIDRVKLHYVIDFIDFYPFPKLWTWVFNVADVAVCVGVGLMILWLILMTVRELRADRAAKANASDTTDGPEN